MRDRLIELLDDYGEDISLCDVCKRPAEDCDGCKNEQLADYLLAKGVIVPPCKIGTTVYEVYRDYTECSAHGIKLLGYCEGCESECDSKPYWAIRDLNFGKYNFYSVAKAFGKTVFLTREEAEKALKDGVE